MFNCSSPGCPNSVDRPKSYCVKHKKLGQQIGQQKHKAIVDRLNSLEQPGKELYLTPEWKKLKKEVIAEQCCCQVCGSTDSLEVHHTIKHGGNPAIFFNRNILQVLCHYHHTIENMKQVRESRGYSEKF